MGLCIFKSSWSPNVILLKIALSKNLLIILNETLFHSISKKKKNTFLYVWGRGTLRMTPRTPDSVSHLAIPQPPKL